MKTPIVRQDQGLALVLGDLEEANDSTENVYNNNNNDNNLYSFLTSSREFYHLKIAYGCSMCSKSPPK